MAKIKVKCVVCDVEGEIEANYEPAVAICEFCYINMRSAKTIDGANKFYVES